MALGFAKTDDGSITVTDGDCSYRSLRGAVTESRHVFLSGCALLARDDRWIVWELGFGCGTNFGVVAAAAAEKGVSLDYHAVEVKPLAPEWLQAGSYQSLAAEVVSGAADCRRAQGPGISLTLYASDWREVDRIVSADAIFHDPFAPADNPDCWTVACFAWQRERLAAHGVLATYSSAGQIVRNMRAAGLEPRRVPGPPGKRQVTVARKAE